MAFYATLTLEDYGRNRLFFAYLHGLMASFVENTACGS